MRKDVSEYELEDDDEEEEEGEGTPTPGSGVSHLKNMGKFRLSKGEFTEDSLFFSWDAVPLCRELNCPIVEVCTYSKGPKVKCAIHSQFLKSLSVILYRNYSDVLDEPRLYRVGLHLMPMYKMLCKLLIEEHAVQNAVYLDNKGVRHAHPIFKEVRETLTCISKEWRSLGLDRFKGMGGGFGPHMVPDPFEHGDPNFHASLESNTPRNHSRRTVDE